MLQAVNNPPIGKLPPVPPGPLAERVAGQYGPTITQMGGKITLDSARPNELTITFGTSGDTSRAAQSLRDAVDGVRLVMQDQAGRPPQEIGHNLDDLRDFVMRADGVVATGISEGRVTIYTQNDDTARVLQPLVREALAGNTVGYLAIGKIKPE